MILLPFLAAASVTLLSPLTTPRLVVSDTKANGVDAGVARVITDAIETGLIDSGAFSVVSNDDVKATMQVEANKRLVGCDDNSCLSELADALNADFIAHSRASKVGSQIVVYVTLFDVKAGAARWKTQVQVNKAEELTSSVATTVRQTALSVAAKRSAPAKVDRALPGFAWIEIPEGTYVIGCATGDAECNEFEKKLVRKTVPAFAASKTETTAAQYDACVAQGKCTAAAKDTKNCTSGDPKRSAHPINCVTYEQAEAFCAWVGGRVPSADEWEVAARGGKDAIYPWGNDKPDAKKLNYCDKGCASALSAESLKIWTDNKWIDTAADDGFAATAPVGSFPRGENAFGLLDVAGNVWEMTSSDAERGAKQIRGGAWSYTPPWMRISMNNRFPVDSHDDAVGFRCVR